MKTSKKEILNKEESHNNKKKRLKKLAYWLAIDIAVAFIVFSLLLYKPSRYHPIDKNTGNFRENEVSPVLTRLSSEIYNNAQLDKPFEITITEDELNDIIIRADWPIESEGMLLYAPAGLINPDKIVLMGTAEFQGIDFVITIELRPNIDENGQLGIDVLKVKVGAVNITPLAKVTAKKMYAEKISTLEDIDEFAWQTKVAAALLNEEIFDPVFEIEGEKVRAKEITIEEDKIKAILIPK